MSLGEASRVTLQEPRQPNKGRTLATGSEGSPRVLGVLPVGARGLPSGAPGGLSGSPRTPSRRGQSHSGQSLPHRARVLRPQAALTRCTGSSPPWEHFYQVESN